MTYGHSSGGVIYRRNSGLDEILLIRVRKDQYELPKGHVEHGESNQRAAIRECYEETGFRGELEIDKYLDKIDYTFETNCGLIHKKVSYFMVKIITEGKFIKPRATLELKWINECEINKTIFVNEALKQIIMQSFH